MTVIYDPKTAVSAVLGSAGGLTRELLDEANFSFVHA